MSILRRKRVVWIQQSCSHPVQLHGLCGICGEDLTTYVVFVFNPIRSMQVLMVGWLRDDYLTRSDSISNSQAGPSRLPGAFELAHDALGVTVSTDVSSFSACNRLFPKTMS